MMMKWIKAYAAAQNTAARRSDGWLREAAACTEAQLLAKLSAAPAGLTEEQAGEAREKYGSNRLAKPRRKSAPRRLLEAFADPFSLVLLLLAVVSAFTDILFVAPGERNYMTVGIITVMVAVSGVLRFVQETRSGSRSRPFRMATKGTSSSRWRLGTRWMRSTPGPWGSSVTWQTASRWRRKNCVSARLKNGME